MKPGTCGCPECERLLRRRGPPVPTTHATLGSCDDHGSRSLASALPPCFVPPAFAVAASPHVGLLAPVPRRRASRRSLLRLRRPLLDTHSFDAIARRARPVEPSEASRAAFAAIRCKELSIERSLMIVHRFRISRLPRVSPCGPPIPASFLVLGSYAARRRPRRGQRRRSGTGASEDAGVNQCAPPDSAVDPAQPMGPHRHLREPGHADPGPGRRALARATAGS